MLSRICWLKNLLVAAIFVFLATGCFSDNIDLYGGAQRNDDQLATVIAEPLYKEYFHKKNVKDDVSLGSTIVNVTNIETKKSKMIKCCRPNPYRVKLLPGAYNLKIHSIANSRDHIGPNGIFNLKSEISVNLEAGFVYKISFVPINLGIDEGRLKTIIGRHTYEKLGPVENLQLYMKQVYPLGSDPGGY